MRLLRLKLIRMCNDVMLIIISVLFVGAVVDINPSRTVSILFILAMTSLIVGLGCFLREISLSVHIFDADK